MNQLPPAKPQEQLELDQINEPEDSVEEEFAPEEAFISHLTELRTRMMIAVGAVLVCFLGLAYWAPQIFNIISEPLAKTLPKGSKMIVTDVTGSFFTPLKVTLYVAFVIALPVILYQIWAFVAPGLYRHEKRFIFPLVLSSFLLFLAGMAFASFFVLPTVFKFMALASTHLQAAEMATDIEKYLSFVLNTFMIFGLAFEVPILVFLLNHSGITTVEQMSGARRYVILLAFIISAVVTPPDVLSQFMLAIPLMLLFELGLLMSRLLIKQDKTTAEKSDVVSEA